MPLRCSVPQNIITPPQRGMEYPGYKTQFEFPFWGYGYFLKQHNNLDVPSA